ncbi:MAG: amino acid ABC transporter substrate-binding protein [Gammaproteobacteria bacterium]|nr:MAG: amino acid ABC transporter substrate-binding protein [Gammaproteobacteria bacterium]
MKLMEWMLKRKGLAFAIVALLSTSMPAHAEEERASYRFCEDPWPPYTDGEVGRHPEKGMAVELFREFSARMEADFELMLLPWKRCLHWVKTGQFDGIMLLTRNEERAQYLLFSDPVHHDVNLVWTRQGRNFQRDFNSFEDLKGLKVGTVAGFNYGEPFNKAVEEYELDIDEGPSILSSLKRLDLNRIDVFLVNRDAGEQALKSEPLLRSRLKYQAGPFEKVPFHIGLSAESPVTREYSQLNDTIADMREDGTLERIFQPHSSPDPLEN